MATAVQKPDVSDFWLPAYRATRDPNPALSVNTFRLLWRQLQRSLPVAHGQAKLVTWPWS